MIILSFFKDRKRLLKRFTASLIFFVLCVVAGLAEATESFENCTSHLIRNSHPSQYPPEDVSISLCKGGMFAIGYDKPMLNPQYSAWSVTGRQVKDNIPGRAGNFRQDDDLKRLKIPHGNASSTVWSIFWNRGHLAPSRMLSSSDWGKYQTYYYSNVAPQWFEFNQQSWEQCEDALFDVVGLKAKSTETIDEPFYVVTGVDYFDREAGVVRNSSIAMPDFYYTAICNPLRKQSFAFVGLNNGSNGGQFLFSYRTVRELELMFSSTSGVIFDDKNEDGSDFVCNTRAIDAMFWKMNRFDSISTFPKSYSTNGSTDVIQPSALSMANIVPLTTLTKFQNATTTKYSDVVAVDRLRVEFEGSHWWRLVGERKQEKSNVSLRAYVRDAFLGTFRKAMRLGNAALRHESREAADRGLLKWPAHGYMMEASVVLGNPIQHQQLSNKNKKKMVRIGGGSSSSVTSLGAMLERRDSTLFAKGEDAPPHLRRRLPSDRGGDAGLVIEISVHRFRSLSVASDNSESANVTDAIATSLRRSDFRPLLGFYMREATSAVKREGGDGSTVVDPSASSGGYFPIKVTILGSDVERERDDDEDDNRRPSPPPTEATTTNARSSTSMRLSTNARSVFAAVALCSILTIALF